MQRPIHREQTIRVARQLRLVHRSRFQRHRYGICLVGAGIVELAVDQNGNRNQRAFTTAAELHNADCPRLLSVLRLLVFPR